MSRSTDTAERAPASAHAPTYTDMEERVLGEFGGERGGPLLLCVGGIHGNEPSGVLAIRRVIVRLRSSRPQFRGRVLAVAGNLAALRTEQRFVDRDLNRKWSRGGVSAAIERPHTVEDGQQAALQNVLVPAIQQAQGKVYLVDLHTTSSPSAPFVTLSDTLETRTFAKQLGMPLILGLEEEIDTMTDYLSGLGVVAVGIEAGEHRDPASVDLHEAAIWLSLEAAGCLPEDTDVVDLEACRHRVSEACEGLPGVFEVLYRRGISPGDEFRMKPGFENFTPVSAGEVVASDIEGPVPAPMSGRLFLPLYQTQGDDGFFLVRGVRRVWLTVSRVLRRVGAPRLLPLLPGVHRSSRHENTLIVSRRVARLLVHEIFHLMGYRRVRRTDRHVVFRGRGPILRD